MYPLLPIFLTTTLGVQPDIVGLIEGIADATGLMITGVSGWFADHFGHYKRVAFIGYSLTALAKPAIAMASTWPLVLGARFGDRFGKGIRVAPRDALLADSVSDDSRGRAFGFERMMDNAGAVAGPLLALALVSAGLSVPKIFLLTFIPGALAAILIIFVHEPKQHRKLAGRLRFSLSGTKPAYLRLLFVTGLFSLGNSTNAFLILRAKSFGMTVTTTILCYALYNAVSSAGSLPAGILSDRVGRRGLLAIGYGLFAAVYAGFALAGNREWMWVLFAAYGLFPALTDGIGKAMAVDLAGSAGRATVVGIYSATIGATQLFASYIGGLLWREISPSSTFFYGSVMSTAATIMVLLILPSSTKTSEARQL